MRLPELSTGQEYLIRLRSKHLQEKADKKTRFRANFSPLLGAAIGLTRPGWATTAAAAYMWKTDYDDGKYAKAAQREMAQITGRLEPLSDGHIEDPKADKRWFWSQTGGILLRSILQKDLKTSLITGAISAVTIWRDGQMSQARQLVNDEQLDLSVAAINTNRAKTALQGASETVLMSPLAENYEPVKNASLAGLAIGTALGVYGMHRYRAQVQTALLEKHAEQAALCPDKIRHELSDHQPTVQPAA